MDDSKVDVVNEYHVVEHGENTSYTLFNSHKRSSFGKLLDRLTNNSNTDIHKMSPIPENVEDDVMPSANMINSIHVDDDHFTDNEDDKLDNVDNKDDILSTKNNKLIESEIYSKSEEQPKMTQLYGSDDSFTNMVSSPINETKKPHGTIMQLVAHDKYVKKNNNIDKSSEENIDNHQIEKNNMLAYVIPIIAVGAYAVSHVLKKRS